LGFPTIKNIAKLVSLLVVNAEMLLIEAKALPLQELIEVSRVA